jgi:hypothetical protein
MPAEQKRRVATSLRLVEDCYQVGIVGEERRRRYEVLDQDGYVLDATALVWEHWDPLPGTVRLGGIWVTGSSTAQFDDHWSQGSSSNATGVQHFSAFTLAPIGEDWLYAQTAQLNILEPVGRNPNGTVVYQLFTSLTVSFLGNGIVSFNGTAWNTTLNPTTTKPKCRPDLPVRL